MDDFMEPVDCDVEYLWSSLVSFHFCCRLILFEYDNKCESVCLFSNVVLCRLCSGEAKWELIIVEAVSKGFVAQGFVWPLAQHIFTFSLSVLSRSECIWFRPAVWSSYYDPDSGQRKPYYDLLEPVVGHGCSPWRVQLCNFSSLVWTFLLFLH